MGKTRLGTGYRVGLWQGRDSLVCVGLKYSGCILVLGAVSHGCEEGMLEMG